MLLSGNEVIRDFMDKLTSSTNVSKYVDLPMIAVMGDTSSGKSSLLSSISMVELPSSSELTTRCPIMLQMRRSEELSATVSISWHETPSVADYHFEPRTVEKENWCNLSNEITAAQSHIIDITGKEVAQDKVLVKLSGPDCEDLTLIDLPGIVRTRGDGEGETIVKDIEALMNDYLKNDRCVILAVVPANVDFHNSQIMADAKEVDPDSTRTIPVITKPDLIDKGGENEVRRLLIGEKMKFRHGFHMVKGRGQAALDADESIEHAIIQEKHFFEKTTPWRSVSEKSKFGTENLRRKLGSLQMTMFVDQVPRILSEIKSNRDDADETLKRMGSPQMTSEARRAYYLALARMLTSGLNDTLKGSAIVKGDITLTARIHDACERFKTQIEQGKLASVSKLNVGDDVKIAAKDGIVCGKVVHVTEHEIFVDYEDRKTKNRPEFVIAYSQLFRKPKTARDDGAWTEGDCVYIARDDRYGDQLKGFPKDKAEKDPKWITEMIKQQRTDELPIFPNPKVFNRIVTKFIDDSWKPACHELATSVADIVAEALTGTLKTLDPSSRYPRLYSLLLGRFNEIKEAFKEDTNRKVEDYIERNKFSYSQNDDMFETISSLQTRALKRQLKVALGLEDGFTNSAMNKDAIDIIVNAVFDRNNRVPQDEYLATSMLHGLEAYGQVAKKRFIDEVPVLLWDAIHDTVNAVEQSLWQVTDDDLKRVMKDSDEFQREYEQKTEELKELNGALAIFQSLL